VIEVRLVGEAVALGFDPEGFGDVTLREWIARRRERAIRAREKGQ